MTSYDVPDVPKMLRETLCVAQQRVAVRADPRSREHVARLQRLIDECDRHRPLGPDGKHGDRHTATCGCEDVDRTDECGPPIDPATGPTYRVGRRNAWCIYRNGERFGITFDPADGPRVVAALNAHAPDVDPRPFFERVAEVRALADDANRPASGSYGPGCADAAPAATDNACHALCAAMGEQMPALHAAGQCPRCTSDRRDHRFVIPVMDGTAYIADEDCPDPWHDQPATAGHIPPDGRLRPECCTEHNPPGQ